MVWRFYNVLLVFICEFCCSYIIYFEVGDIFNNVSDNV